MTIQLNIKSLIIVAAITFTVFFLLSATGINGFLIGSAKPLETSDKETPASEIAIDEVRLAAVGDTGTGGSE